MRGNGDLEDVDGNGEALTGEDCVHDGDVLVCEVGGRGGGDEKNPGLQFVLVL